jgi:hypothetical protein
MVHERLLFVQGDNGRCGLCGRLRRVHALRIKAQAALPRKISSGGQAGREEQTRSRWHARDWPRVRSRKTTRTMCGPYALQRERAWIKAA